MEASGLTLDKTFYGTDVGKTFFMTDAGKTIYCEHLWHAGHWRSAQRVQTDRAGMITAVTGGEAQSGDEILAGWVIPGMPNLHSHAFQYLLSGRTGYRSDSGDSFWTWRKLMYRLIDQLDPRQFEAVTAWCYLQLLKGGYTSVAEFHYVHHRKNGEHYAERAEMANRVINAATRTGIGLTLLPVLYRYSAFGEQELEAAQAPFSNSLESYLDILGDIRNSREHGDLLFSGAAPHSLRAVGKSLLQELLESLPPEQAFHMHIAEQRNEVDACVQHCGQRPVEWLLENFPVDHSWCLVHATHMTDSELRRTAASGAIVGLCPTTEADLGDGIFPAVDWRESGGTWGIGSDSNLRTVAAEELRLLEFTQRLKYRQRNLMTRTGTRVGDGLYGAALSGGAQALHQPVGKIEPGYRADLVQLDHRHPMLADGNPGDILDRYIFANSEQMISRVLVAGRTVIEHGRHEHDESLQSAFESVVKALF